MMKDCVKCEYHDNGNCNHTTNIKIVRNHRGQFTRHLRKISDINKNGDCILFDEKKAKTKKIIKSENKIKKFIKLLLKR